MAEQAEHEDDLDLDIDGDDTQPGVDTGDTLNGGEGEDSIEGGDADDEVEVVFGDEVAPTSRGEDSGLVKQLRAEIRKRDQLLAARPQAAPQPIEVGDKPTLESCEYEEDRYDSELEAWKARKAEAEKADAAAQEQTQAVQARFAEKLEAFGRQRADFKAPDFEAAELAVVTGLSQVQQAIVVKAAENSAAMIYALGRHPQKLATLAAIADPFEFAAALGKLEGTLKVTKRTRTPPEPDVAERGSAPLSQSSDKELERLEAQAAKSGDRTAVVAYKRKLKAQGRS